MTTLTDLFETFKERGDATAFVYRTGVRRFVFSYRDLHLLSLKTARLLEERGIQKGDRVLLWAPNSPWWGIVFWGIIARGAVVVPVDFMSGKERAQTIAELTQSKLIIQSQYKLDKLAVTNALLVEELEYLLEEIVPVLEIVESNPDDTAEIIYTSGSTGDPKGVVLTHRNLTANLSQIKKSMPPVGPEWKFLSLLPLSHTLEQMGGFFVPLCRSSSIVYLRTLKPSALMEAFAAEDIYVAIMVPRLLQALKSAIERELARKHLGGIAVWLIRHTDSLKKELRRKIFFPVHKKFGRHFAFFVSGGAPLDAEVWRFWQALGFDVLEGYGLTECSPVLALTTIEKQVMGSAGQAIPGVQLKIQNNEIVAKGDNIFPGYYHNDVATREAFTPDGWFQTGDLGAFDTEGDLFIKGRRKEMIVTGAGVNVFPEDVERVLNVIDGVRESCVIGVNSGEGEEVHAVLIIDGTRTPEETIQKANEKLDPQQQITGFSLWDEPEFPKTTTLKIRRFQVQERVAQGMKSNASHTQDKLVYLISKVTGKPADEIKDISILAADLGLTSIGRLELVSFIEQEFRLDLEDTFITQKTTVSDLRSFIGRREVLKGQRRYRSWINTRPIALVRQLHTTLLYCPFMRIFIRPRPEGLENLREITGPVIFIANHQSFADHPSILLALPSQFRHAVATATWEEFFFEETLNVAKKVWKRFAYHYSAVFLNLFPFPQQRGFRDALQYMGRLVDGGTNILFFPEGGHSKDTKVQPFKQGLGMIAKELAVPIVPIKIIGTHDILAPGHAIPHRGKVRVIFGRPIYFRNESPGKIVERTRQAIIDLSS